MLQKTAYRSEDDPFLFQLYASTRVEELQAWGWDETIQHAFLTMQWTAQHRSYAVQYPTAEHSILYFQNLRAGRIIVNHADHELTLVDFSLLPEFRNRGLGTALLQELQSEATRIGKPLRLSVLKSNPAKLLYRRLGFTTTGENELYDFMEWCTATI